MDTPFYTISWYVSDSKRRSFFKDSVQACFFGLAELFLFQNASSFTPVVEPACKYVKRCKYMYMQHHLSKYCATIQYNTIHVVWYARIQIVTRTHLWTNRVRRNPISAVCLLLYVRAASSKHV